MVRFLLRALASFVCLCLLFIVVGVGSVSMSGQDFPNRPVTIVVPFSAGGAADMLARVLSDGLRNRWKQPVILDYRPGAGTIVGTDVVARATPDGYTLGIVVTSFVINPAVREDLPYDSSADFRGVSQLGEAPIVLLRNPAFAPDSIDQLMATPGRVSYAIPGIGTATHMAGELLARMAGMELVPVPYGGLAQALPDVLSGRVPLLFDIWHSARPYVEAGSLKILAVASPGGVPGHPEFESLPDRFPGFSAVSMQGVVVPAGTPDGLVQLLARDIQAVVRSSAFAATVDDFGMQAVGSSPDEFEAFLQQQIERWIEIAHEAGIHIDD